MSGLIEKPAFTPDKTIEYEVSLKSNAVPAIDFYDGVKI